MSGFDISVVGRVYVDHVFAGFKDEPKLGTEIYCSSYNRSIGGGAAITSYWLGSMGRNVQVACITGKDDIAWFRGEFERVGVNTDLVRPSALNTGITAAVTLGHDRELFTHLGANVGLDQYLDDDVVLERLCTARHLHLTVPLKRAVARKVIDRVHDAGLTVSMDVGYQPWWYSDPVNQETLRDLDFFFPNETEAELLNLSDPRNLSDWFGNGESNAAPRATRWVVVKRGSAGAFATNESSCVMVKAPTVESVDTTGAGEAFNAGFIDAFLQGGDIGAWLRRGCACGALSVSGLGGITAAVGRHEVNEIEGNTYGI